MKAGTTSLHSYLSMHPDIFMSRQKELNYFNTSLNWSKGIEWYESNFDDSYLHRGETSPNYSKWEGTAERVYSVIPNAKIIYILRNPASRFESECNHLQVNPNQEVKKLISGKESQIFKNGLYNKWYLEYSKFFPTKNILLIKSENLKNDPEGTLKSIFCFLGVKNTRHSTNHPSLLKSKHITRNKDIPLKGAIIFNKFNILILLKSFLKSIFPFLRPIWSSIFYRKRSIKRLNNINKSYLMKRYRKDLNSLKKISGIDY